MDTRPGIAANFLPDEYSCGSDRSIHMYAILKVQTTGMVKRLGACLAFFARAAMFDEIVLIRVPR